MGLTTPWYRKGGTSMESSIPCSHGGRALLVKRGRGGRECKLQVPRQGRRPEAKELHKTGVDRLLIKIAKSEGHWVDAGVLDQGTKLAVRGIVTFLLRGVGGKGDEEDDQSLTTQQQRRRVAGSQRGMLQPKQKIEDSTKYEEMQRLQWLR
ncbi:hypothetical protein GW17_00062439 [Ensete ventricosum]|nr:hypothetical protein GW17_00062439 [Ensete ventricosum]RZS27884.1 hypothetical protein BHM03_00061417 [Ensete ventricosum]